MFAWDQSPEISTIYYTIDWDLHWLFADQDPENLMNVNPDPDPAIKVDVNPYPYPRMYTNVYKWITEIGKDTFLWCTVCSTYACGM